MAIKNEPDKFDCYENALSDEPMFILLARDHSAPDLVERWAFIRSNEINNGEKPLSDRAQCVEALQCAEKMRAWRITSPNAQTVAAVVPKEWQPTHRHIKTGVYYQVLMCGQIEKDCTPVVIYRGINGRVWIRPTAEFKDGRFETIATAPLMDAEVETLRATLHKARTFIRGYVPDRTGRKSEVLAAIDAALASHKPTEGNKP